MVSSNASFSAEDIIAAASPSQTLFYQLYKNANDAVAEKRVREIEALGYKAIFLTVDAVNIGNREFDTRVPWVLEDMERGTPKYYVEGEVDEAELLGTAGALIAKDDRDMTWEKVGLHLL